MLVEICRQLLCALPIHVCRFSVVCPCLVVCALVVRSSFVQAWGGVLVRVCLPLVLSSVVLVVVARSPLFVMLMCLKKIRRRRGRSYAQHMPSTRALNSMRAQLTRAQLPPAQLLASILLSLAIPLMLLPTLATCPYRPCTPPPPTMPRSAN